MAVLDDDYLVGKVVDVTYSTSRVLLLSDLNSKIPVDIMPNSIKSILSGTGEESGIIQYIKSEIGTFSKFILDLSNDFPIAYGLLSIILAITLGVIGSFIRKMLSDNKTKLKQLAGL